MKARPGQREADDDEPHVGLRFDARPSLGDRHEHGQVDDGDEDAGHGREDVAPPDRVVVHQGHGEQNRDHDRLGDQPTGHPVAQLPLGGVRQVKPHLGRIGTGRTDLYRRGSDVRHPSCSKDVAAGWPACNPERSRWDSGVFGAGRASAAGETVVSDPWSRLRSRRHCEEPIPFGYPVDRVAAPW